MNIGKPLKKRGEELLASLVAEIPKTMSHKEMVLIGVPGPMIAALANEEEGTAVVMGNSGKGALSSLYYGQRKPVCRTSC